MQKLTYLPLLTFTIMLGACTSSDDRQLASGSSDYLEAEETPVVQAPEGLVRPPFSSDYLIDVDTPPLTEKVRVIPPRQVLPVVTGSYVNEGNRKAQVSFDQITDEQPLDQRIWDAVLNYCQEQQISVLTFDQSAGVLSTDWVIQQQGEASWWSTSTAEEHALRFDLVLQLEPHGRSGQLGVDLVQYQSTVTDLSILELSDPQKSVFEIEFLNQILAHMDYLNRLDESRKLMEIRRGFSSQLIAVNDQKVIEVSGRSSFVWPRILLSLQQLDFELIDYDQSNGLIFVDYDPDAGGLFGGLFSTDDIGLEQGRYQLLVTSVNDGTTRVRLLTNENEAVTEPVMSRFFNAFQPVVADDDIQL